MSKDPSPQTSSNKGRYSARESRYAMQAVSGKPCSLGSTGGNCACSASGLLNLYPVERESQKFPPRKTFNLRKLADFLAESPNSPIRRFTPAGANIDSHAGVPPHEPTSNDRR